MRVKTIVVGCGQPKVSMGWFHLHQLTTHPSVELVAVVEPWCAGSSAPPPQAAHDITTGIGRFLGAGASTPGAVSFETMRADLAASHPACQFFSSVSDLTINAGPVLAIVAGRTCDAPRYFTELCDKGVTHIYLEKPGADNAGTLEQMRQLADQRGISVVVGYNKNVADYVREALAAIARRDQEGQVGCTPPTPPPPLPAS